MIGSAKSHHSKQRSPLRDSFALIQSKEELSKTQRSPNIKANGQKTLRKINIRQSKPMSDSEHRPSQPEDPAPVDNSELPAYGELALKYEVERFVYQEVISRKLRRKNRKELLLRKKGRVSFAPDSNSD